MAAATLVYVTGYKPLDAKLRAMPAAMQRKFVRGGLRKGGKRVVNAARTIVRNEAYETGAFDESLKVTALKRSRTRAGVAILPKREVLFAKYAAKHGGKTPSPASGENAPYYYVATIEYGDEHHQPVRPLRRGLYDNQGTLLRLFRQDVLEFIANNKVDSKIPRLPRVKRP